MYTLRGVGKTRRAKSYKLYHTISGKAYWLELGRLWLVLVVLFTIGVSTIPAGGSDQTVSLPRTTTVAPATLDHSSNAPVRVQPSTAGVASIIARPSATSASTVTTPAWLKLAFYDDPTNEATVYYQSNSNAPDASLIEREGSVPVADWIGDWTANVQSEANRYITAASQANSLPTLVFYNIPDRDCGNYSAGGASSMNAYIQWVQNAASGIGNRQAIVILEPDALAGSDCLTAADQQARFLAIAQAVTILKTNTKATVYIDAGNPDWQPAPVMAQRLQAANISQADGFSLNVSNFISTSQNQAYGDQISKLVGGKHYIVDTSRNGSSQVSPNDWCNPPTAALGSLPTTTTGDTLNDALIWIKIPWESDGSCNGSPAAGAVDWPFAIQLAKNAGWH